MSTLPPDVEKERDELIRLSLPDGDLNQVETFRFGFSLGYKASDDRLNTTREQLKRMWQYITSKQP